MEKGEDEIRIIETLDISLKKDVTASTRLFATLYVENMISDIFKNPKNQAHWYIMMKKDKLIAIANCEAEKYPEIELSASPPFMQVDNLVEISEAHKYE